MTTYKTCTGCGRKLLLSEFAKNKYAKNGIRSRCRECCNEATRKYRNGLPKEERLRKQRVWIAKNPKSYFVTQAKRMARNAGVPFDLKKEDIEIPKKCPLLGVDLVFLTEKHKHPESASIDRVVPRLGYVKGNVRIISEMANRIKTNATPEQIKIIAARIDSYVKGED